MRTGIVILAMATAVTGAYAQKGVTDGSRYGHGADSIECLKNISIYTEHVKSNAFAEAYPYWKAVFTDAPLAQAGTYTNGAKILRGLISAETDTEKKTAYAEELQAVYSQRLKYLDELNKLVKTPVEKAEVMGLQAHDYITYNTKISVAKAYTLLRDAVTEGKESTTYYVLGDLMKISNQKFKSEKDAHRDALLQDYIDCSTYINNVIAGIEDNEQLLTAARNTKENIDAYFVNSGAADCESLQAIYAPKIEENKTDFEYLNKVVKVMGMLKCTDSEAYFTAAEYAHNISPTSATAKSLGYMSSKREDYEKALEYFDQAIELETDASEKSDIYYTASVILFSSMKNTTKAKSYIQKSIASNPNNGNSYILLAQMYASNHKWTDEAALNQCTFFVVLDKLQKAKSVDPSVAERANELIKQYSEYTPKIEDLFMLQLKKGDQVEVKGWINEVTTIR